MDSKKIGGFVAALRKEKNMTQQDLADRLDVTNKAVSRWETGEGYPEITIVPGLAEILGVTVDELLRGERAACPDESYGRSTPEKGALVDCLANTALLKFRNMNMVSQGIAVAGVTAFFALTFTTLREWIGFGVLLLFFTASVVLFGIIYNNLKASEASLCGLHPNGGYQGVLIVEANRQLIKSIYLWALFLLMALPFVMFFKPGLPLVLPILHYLQVLPAFLLLGGFIVYVFCQKLGVRLGVGSVIAIFPDISRHASMKIFLFNIVSFVFGAVLFSVTFLPVIIQSATLRDGAEVATLLEDMQFATLLDANQFKETWLVYAGLAAYVFGAVVFLYTGRNSTPLPYGLIYGIRNFSVLCILTGSVVSQAGSVWNIFWTVQLEWPRFACFALYALLYYFAVTALLKSRTKTAAFFSEMIHVQTAYRKGRGPLNIMSALYAFVLFSTLFFSSIYWHSDLRGFNYDAPRLMLFVGLAVYAAIALVFILKNGDVRLKLEKAFCAVRNLASICVLASSAVSCVEYVWSHGDAGWLLKVSAEPIITAAMVSVLLVAVLTAALWLYDLLRRKPDFAHVEAVQR